jgi:hypothetical protein
VARGALPLDTAETRAPAAHAMALLRFKCGTVVVVGRLDALRAVCEVRPAHRGVVRGLVCGRVVVLVLSRVPPVTASERGWWCPACGGYSILGRLK